MTDKKDPYASEAETQALMVPDTRTAAERKLAQMMTERGADEQGAEAALPWDQRHKKPEPTMKMLHTYGDTPQRECLCKDKCLHTGTIGQCKGLPSVLAAPVQQEPKLPEFYAALEYDNPGWDVVVAVYQRREDATPLLVHREMLPNQPPAPVQQEACPTCGEYEPRIGTCGTSPNDKRALCNRNAPQPAQRKPPDVIKAAQGVLEFTEIAHRPPVRDQLEVGRMVMVRLHALADLHDALTAQNIKEQP